MSDTTLKPASAMVAPAVLAVGCLLVEAPAADAKPSCFGKKATVVGSNGKDRLKGSPGKDVVVAKGGKDSVSTSTGLQGDGAGTLLNCEP